MCVIRLFVDIPEEWATGKQSLTETIFTPDYIGIAKGLQDSIIWEWKKWESANTRIFGKILAILGEPKYDILVFLFQNRAQFLKRFRVHKHRDPGFSRKTVGIFKSENLFEETSLPLLQAPFQEFFLFLFDQWIYDNSPSVREKRRDKMDDAIMSILEHISCAVERLKSGMQEKIRERDNSFRIGEFPEILPWELVVEEITDKAFRRRRIFAVKNIKRKVFDPFGGISCEKPQKQGMVVGKNADAKMRIVGMQRNSKIDSKSHITVIIYDGNIAIEVVDGR